MEASSTPVIKAVSKENPIEKTVLVKSNVIVSPSPQKVTPNIAPKILAAVKPALNQITTTPIASTSKVFIITPEQIAKLGLTQQLNKAVESQIKPVNKNISECREKKGIRFSKITILNSSENGKAAATATTTKTETIDTTGTNEKNVVAKGKLLNLLKSRSATTTTTTEKTNSDLKRKYDSVEESSRKVPKVSDSDVIVLDGDDEPAEKNNKQISSANNSILLNSAVPKPKFTILNITKPIITSTSVIKPVSNVSKINTTSEDTKQKIQVLKNEQISLPSRYIQLLKSNTGEKQQCKLFPVLNISTDSSNIDKAGDPIVIEDDVEKSTVPKCEKIIEDPLNIESIKVDKSSVSSLSETSHDGTNIEELERDFVNKDMILLINNSEYNLTDSEIKNDDAVRKEPEPAPEQSKEVDTNTNVIDLTAGDENKNSIDDKPLLQNTDTDSNLIKSSKEEKSTLNITEQSSEVIDITEDDSVSNIKHRPSIIRNFSEIIKSKLNRESNTKSLLGKEDIKFRSNILKTYGKKNRLLTESSVIKVLEIKNPVNPQVKESSTSITLNIEKPLEVSKTYNKRKTILIKSSTKDVLKTPVTQAKILEINKNNQLKPTDSKSNLSGNQSKITQNSDDNNMESIIIDDNDSREASENKKELASNNEQNETPKVPKKRGRKKKSELIKIQQKLEAQKIVEPEPELETSKRGRKRKVVNYCALAEGDIDIDAMKSYHYHTDTLSEDTLDSDLEEKTPKRGKQRRPKKVKTDIQFIGESRDENKHLEPLNENVENSTVEETPNRRRPGRPRKIKPVVVDENPEVNKNSETNNDNDDSKSKEQINTDENSESLNDKVNSKLEEQTPQRRKPGRPRKIKSVDASEPSNDNESNEPSVSVKNENIEDFEVDNNTETLGSEANTSTEEVKIKRRRGRPGRSSGHVSKVFGTFMKSISTPFSEEKKIKQEEEGAKEATNDIKSEPLDPNTSGEHSVVEQHKNSSLVMQTKRKGRKKRILTDPLAIVVDGVTCAICNKEMNKSEWGNHKLRYHNNLAWRIGDTPLDLHDERLVMNILSDIYRKKKPLFCELCGMSKKSVIGYMSHKATCQKSQEEISAMRISCEYCGKPVMPVSMASHIKFCRKANSLKSDTEDSFTTTTHDDVMVEGKRKAAKKAKDLIKSIKDEEVVKKPKSKRLKCIRMWIQNYDFQPNFFAKRRFNREVKNGSVKCRFEDCQFESSDVDEILDHLYVCDKKPKEGYTCKYCIITYKTEAEVTEHVKELHSTNAKASSDNDELGEEEEEDDDDYDDYEDEDGDEDCEDNILIKNKLPVNKSTSEYKSNSDSNDECKLGDL